MVWPEEYRPLRLSSDNLIQEELPDELMIYDSERNKAFCLNQAAAFVWNHSDGTKTVMEIAQLMGQRLGKPMNEQVVRYALDILSKDGLLSPSTSLPASSSRVTRRELLRKLGAGAATAVPLITVLLVSPTQSHASSIGTIATGNTGENDWDFLVG